MTPSLTCRKCQTTTPWADPEMPDTCPACGKRPGATGFVLGNIVAAPVALEGFARMLLEVHQQLQAARCASAEPVAPGIPPPAQAPPSEVEAAKAPGHDPANCPTCNRSMDAQSFIPADIALTFDELVAITGYRSPTRQVAELRRQGFYRARPGRLGGVILERAHFEAVCRGDSGEHPRPMLKSERRAMEQQRPKVRPLDLTPRRKSQQNR